MSELPETWVTHVEYDVDGSPYYFSYEGNYEESLPFDPEESRGVTFEMDTVKFEICGDFGGHAMYRRVNGDDSLYSMPWRELSARTAEGTIEITGVC